MPSVDRGVLPVDLSSEIIVKSIQYVEYREAQCREKLEEVNLNRCLGVSELDSIVNCCATEQVHSDVSSMYRIHGVFIACAKT
jgi:hypothetical protein